VSESIVKRSLTDLNGAKRAVLAKDKDKEEKVFLFQELTQSAEYPHTLDLRRKWAKQ